MNWIGGPVSSVVEGFFFALGFWPAYVGLDWLAGHIPAWRKMRAARAAKVLRQMPQRKTSVKTFKVVEEVTNEEGRDG